MTSHGLVDLCNVGFRYPGSAVTLFEDFTAEFCPGEMHAVVGPSGSGKSTFLSIAAGIRPPSSGEALLFDTPISASSTETLRRLRAQYCGVVFQQVNLLSQLTVIENMQVAAFIAGLQPGLAMRRAGDLLSRLDVGHLAGQRSWELSGGERMRVALC